MSQDDGAERSHEATPQKLEEARRKGEIVRSQDLSTWASYLGVLLCLVLVAPGAAERLTDLGGTLLQDADTLSAPLRTGTPGMGGAVIGHAMLDTALLVAPAAVLVVAVIAVQRAFVAAPEKLGFKLQRISVLANAKNKFGPTGLFEFAKSGAKLLIYAGILGWFLAIHADRMVAAAAADPRAVPRLLPRLLIEFAAVVAIVSGVVAAIDYLWQRHAHLTKNRMTRQEVLDEMKQSEGDPTLRAARRQKAQEIALNRMIHDVPTATVVVVNPTHYAVALKWSPLDPSPPVCVAKGVDAVAARIREAAASAGVPIYSDPPTARALHATVEIGAPIEREHFAAVAAAVRFARALDGGRRT